MNERFKKLALQAGAVNVWEWASDDVLDTKNMDAEKFAELIIEDMHKKVIASILITDVVMEEKGQVPTSEDYIRAINKDFGVEE